MKIQVDGPTIKRWERDIEIVRSGRGYSKAELVEVGLRDLRNVRNHGIPVDPLRKTSYSENVERLKVVAKTIVESRESKTKTRDRDSKKKTDIKKKKYITKNKKPTKQSPK
jgi:ribosomal protein L13E